MEWFGDVLDRAVKEPVTLEAAKLVWREWGEAEKRFPSELWSSFVKFVDSKLRSKGYPTLREIISATEAGVT